MINNKHNITYVSVMAIYKIQFVLLLYYILLKSYTLLYMLKTKTQNIQREFLRTLILNIFRKLS